MLVSRVQEKTHKILIDRSWSLTDIDIDMLSVSLVLFQITQERIIIPVTLRDI